jgi:hypothetical protein
MSTDEKMDPMKWIYALREPNLKHIRYVGQTKNMKTRLAGHINAENTAPVAIWVKALKSNGYQPIVILLEEVNDYEADERERFWIRHYRQQGQPLLNMHLGRNIQPKGVTLTTLGMPPDLRSAIEAEVERRREIGIGASITSFCIEAIESYLKHTVPQTSRIVSIKLNTWRRDDKNSLWIAAQQLLASHALIGERYYLKPDHQLLLERTREGFDLIDGKDVVGMITVEGEDISDEITDADLSEMYTPLATTDTKHSEGLPEV